MENPRTTSARDHDDSPMIDAAGEAGGGGGVVGRTGGHLATDIGTQDELTQAVADPEAHTRATKQDDIDNNVAQPSDRRGNAGVQRLRA